MASNQVKRKLAAILAADIVGYSRLMGADEAGTLARLKEYRRELIDPKNKQYRGRVVKTTGDGILIEFPSVVDAVSCAIEVQQGMLERNVSVSPEKRIEFRIGVNLGDVIVEGRDLYGDGVNIAARLEGLAEPGGICISETVLNHTRGKITFNVEDLGEQSLKNIAQPVHIYCIVVNSGPKSAMLRSQEPSLALPDKPSIAVLPFQNMSGDPEQEYFADGIVEEIITALSQMRWLFVIARNSSFAYKGKSPDIRQVGRELGVRYVLEGSVRKGGNRLRITGQLIDAATGAHLWAGRFDGSVDDVFELQDHVTSSVIGAIAPKLEQAEIERATRKPTENLDAYDHFLRGLASLYKTQFSSREANEEALRFFNRAIELDPGFASAYAWAAYCYVDRKASGWTSSSTSDCAETQKLAGRAVQLGSDNADALTMGGWAFAYVLGDLEAGAAFIDRALELNPNLAIAWFIGGWIKTWVGEPEAGIDRHARAMRLSPIDPHMPRMQQALAHANFFAGHYVEALALAAMALRSAPDLLPALRINAACNAMAGKLEPAQKSVARLRQLHPALRVSNLKDFLGPYRRPEDIAKYEEGLRRAGLPE